jgi:hypothetical protein
MACISREVPPGIPHHITRRGNRRHASGNEYGVPRIPGGTQGVLQPERAWQRDRIVYRVHPACGAVLVVAIGRRAEGSREEIYRLAQRLLRLRLLE